jgi:two-component SAPR family response regulator
MFKKLLVNSHKIDAQSLEKLESQLHQLICRYHNSSDIMQIVRVAKPNAVFFERSLMPNQYVEFAASATDLLEIYECSAFSLIFTDTIPCSQLIADGIDGHHNLAKTNNVATVA